MRLAIIGSGISGLTCAHRLHPRHEIVVYEAERRLGGHTHTVDVGVRGRRWAVDSGFIVFNERTYPSFVALLDELGVASQPTEMSISVRCDRSGLEYAGRSLGSLFAQPSNLLRPSFLRMLRDVVRFGRDTRAWLPQASPKTTLRELVASRYSEAFVDHYLVPMGAAIWSAPPDRFLDIPALTFARFFQNHGLLELRDRPVWRVVRGGSRRYVDALVRPFRPRIRSGTAVLGVRRSRRGVWVRTAAGRERYDRVVIATHSDQALALLEDPAEAEVRVLSAIRYQPNEAILHTDVSMLPRRRRAWASWNYRVPGQPRHAVSVTYDMNALQGIEAPERFLVTLNGADSIEPSRILRRIVYAHPVLDEAAVAAQALHEHIDGVRRTHFCGAYWFYGFHEDGVRSALRVCDALERA